MPLLEGRVDAITIPALRNSASDPSYPSEFRVTPQTRSISSAVIVKRSGFEAVPSLTCRDFRRTDLPAVPLLLKKGLENFLVVFGDPYPHYNLKDYAYRKAEDLIKGVRTASDGASPCLGAVTNQYAVNREREISRTLAKADAGADYIITNSAFDEEHILKFIDDLRSSGVTIPVFVQLSIPHGLNNLLFVGRKFGIPVPEKVRDTVRENPFGGGVQVAANAYDKLKDEVSGIHLSYLYRSHNPIPTYTRLLDAIEPDRKLVVSIQSTLRV